MAAKITPSDHPPVESHIGPANKDQHSEPAEQSAVERDLQRREFGFVQMRSSAEANPLGSRRKRMKKLPELQSTAAITRQ